MTTLTLSIIGVPEQSVDLHAEPLHLARELMAAAGAPAIEIPDLGVETERGRVYDPDEVDLLEPQLAAAVAQLDRTLAADQLFTERQELRAALRLFSAARAYQSGVELGV